MAHAMKFDLYSRRLIDIRREHGAWVAYQPGNGIASRLHDLIIPPELAEHELLTYFDDIFHEMGEPGRSVRRLD